MNHRLAATLCLFALCCAAHHEVVLPGTLTTKDQDQLFDWIYGEQYRIREPARAEAQLLFLPLADPVDKAAPYPRQCIPMSSLLPIGQQGDRVFLIIDGRLAIVSTGGEPKFVDFRMQASFLRLLANAVTERGIELLAQLRINRGSRPIRDEIWRLMIQNQQVIDGQPLLQNQRLSDRHEFFSKYSIARCQAHGERCLILTNFDLPDARGQTFVDQEGGSDGTLTPVRNLAQLDVREVAWATSDAIYLVVACSSGTNANQTR